MSKTNDGKDAERAIANTFKTYFIQKKAKGVKTETMFRVAWIPRSRGRYLGKPMNPERTLVRIPQVLDDFIGCTIPAGRMIFLGVKSDGGKSLGIGLKSTGVKEDQLRNLLAWAKAGAISRVLWYNLGDWFQIPASILQAAAVRGGPIQRQELEDLNLQIPIRSEWGDLVDFLSLDEAEADTLKLPERRTKRRTNHLFK